MKKEKVSLVIALEEIRYLQAILEQTKDYEDQLELKCQIFFLKQMVLAVVGNENINELEMFVHSFDQWQNSGMFLASINQDGNKIISENINQSGFRKLAKLLGA